MLDAIRIYLAKQYNFGLNKSANALNECYFFNSLVDYEARGQK